MNTRQRVLVATGALLAMCVGVPALVAADDNKVYFPGGAAQRVAPDSSGGTANMVTLVLALVLAAAGAWLVWRKRRAGGVQREAHALAIHETRSLGNRQYLVVAAYEGRKFLLGVCPGRIDMLAPLGERRAPEQSAP